MLRIRNDLVGVVMIPMTGGRAPVVLYAGDTVPPGCAVGPHVTVTEAPPVAPKAPKGRRKKADLEPVAEIEPAVEPDVED
jgi:hypothetical protein